MIDGAVRQGRTKAGRGGSPRRSSLCLALLLSVGALGTAAVPAAPGVGLTLIWVSGTVTSTCDEVALDPLGNASYNHSCPTDGAIRPGVRADSCTLGWVVTDGTDLYIATAGHCGGVGSSVTVSGIGPIGSVVYGEFQGDLANLRDWAFIRIDPGLHAFVNPTMVHFGGPTGAGGLIGLDPVRPPVPGDGVLQYGHGYGMGQEESTKARAGAVAAVTPTAFLYVGTVGGGDSGSPVRFATGEAGGITVAAAGFTTSDNRDYVPNRCAEAETLIPGTCVPYWDACDRLDGACDGVWQPGGTYGAVVVTRLDVAIEAFEMWLGKPVTVPAGDLPSATLAVPSSESGSLAHSRLPA